MAADLAELLAQVRAGAAAAFELADRIERAAATPDLRVATALGIKRRGGEPGWRAERRAERDAAIRLLAEHSFPGMSAPQRAKALITKINRYLANGWPHDRERGAIPGVDPECDLLRQIAEADLAMPRPRQMIGILAE